MAPPSLNAYYRTWKGRILISKEGRGYRAKVALAAIGTRPLQGPVAVTARLYRPARRGDLDNSLKALFDSLNGVAWVDDAQVVELHALRRDDKTRPRVEVVVNALMTTEEAEAVLGPVDGYFPGISRSRVPTPALISPKERK